ncbi:MAG TPA: hypothetical protein VK826_08725 [Bacteroidia bacterium]|nr:hypothetical protein [Bacteroidia bacterium]
MKAVSRFIILLFLFPLTGWSQDAGYARAYAMLNTNHVKPVTYQRAEPFPGRATIYLECPFAQPQFLNPAAITPAKAQLIEKVQLVYTTFRSDESFSQQKLNQQRLKNLQAVLPNAFTSAMTEWELVGQTGATTPEEGREYFHGFVITYRIPPSETAIKEEITLLDSAFMGKIVVRKGGGDDSLGMGIPPVGDGSLRRSDVILPDGSIVTLRRDIPEDSLIYYLRPSSPGATLLWAKYSDTAHTTLIVMERFGDHKRKRVWKLEEHKEDPKDFDFLGKKYLNNPDSVVMTTLRRNAWTNFVLVCDVTGSMSPYTAQIFASLPAVIENRRCKGFLFFNDGDKKTTAQKKDGHAGGLYITQMMRFDSVYYCAQKCMNNGDGGDLPENNVEALLRAEKMNPGGELVLVADNWATPRDLGNCDKINQPVHVILCGARGGVNPDYLFLARVTGGSVHTRDQDVTNLASLQEGDQVKVGFQTFLLHDDHFIPFENFSRDF